MYVFTCGSAAADTMYVGSTRTIDHGTASTSTHTVPRSYTLPCAAVDAPVQSVEGNQTSFHAILELVHPLPSDERGDRSNIFPGGVAGVIE